MQKRPFALLCGLVLLVAVATVVVSLWTDSDSPPVIQTGTANKHPDTSVEWASPSVHGFVGSSACEECHAEIAAAYAKHPMAQSFRTTDAFNWSEYPVGESHRVTGGRAVLEVRVRNGELTHHELLLDQTGAAISDSSHEMTYVVGSGQRALAFLERRNDALFMSPVNWYANSHAWGRAPSYQPDDPRRFDRRVHDQCLACHTGIPASGHRRANAFPRPLLQESSIGCEKCHGPGAVHIAWHNGEQTVDSPHDPIVNPAKLQPHERESVCYQCHLQGVARVQRPQRSDFDFRPGQNFEDVWTVLVADSGIGPDGRTRAINHVTQMHDSLCFKASDGALGCISCHDPHRVPAPEERVAFYRAKCLNCHVDEACGLDSLQRESRQNSCVACHMPQRDASNISHVSQTDHRIIRTAESPDAVAGARHDDSQPKLALSFFAAADQRLPDWERSRALGLGAWLYLRKNGMTPPASLGAEFQKALAVWPQDGDVLTTFAALQVEHGRLEEALRLYQTAAELPQSRENALEGCLQCCYLLGRWEMAARFADELLTIESSLANVHAMRADALWNLNRRAEAIEAARQALTLNPQLIPVREWLIDRLVQTGQAEDARQQQRLLQQIRAGQPASG